MAKIYVLTDQQLETWLLAELEKRRQRMATREQVEQLLVEAGEAGDELMVACCRLALTGDRMSLQQCAEAIADAAAMDDE